MPELARFFGTIIRMYAEPGAPHHRPHFHAYYQNYTAVYGIDPVEMLSGELPRRMVFFIALILFTSMLGPALARAQPAVVQVTIASRSAAPGSLVTFPILLSSLEGKSVVSYQFVLAYPGTLLAYSKLVPEGTLSPPVILNTSAPDTIRGAAASFDTLTTSVTDTLLKIQFRVKTDVQGSGTLDFLDFQFNEGDPLAIWTSGTFTVLGEPTLVEETAGPPAGFHLFANIPNPFNPATRITYQLPLPSRVELHILNLLGQPVVTLLAAWQPAGLHRLWWDGCDGRGRALPSGVYLYRLLAWPVDGATRPFLETRKMVLVR